MLNILLRPGDNGAVRTTRLSYLDWRWVSISSWVVLGDMVYMGLGNNCAVGFIESCIPESIPDGSTNARE